MQEECGDAAGIAVVLGELRSEYYQIRKAEMLMQRHRDKWMRSVEQWLDNQARAMKLPADGALWPTRRTPRQRKMQANAMESSRQLQLEAPRELKFERTRPLQLETPREVTQLAPQRPCRQPMPALADDLDIDIDSPHGSETLADLRKALDESGEDRVRSSRLSRGSNGASHEAQESARNRETVKNRETVRNRLPQQRNQVSILSRRASVSPTWRIMARSRRQTNEPDQPRECGTVKCIVQSPLFDSICAVMIALNSVIIGIGVEEQAQGDPEESLFLKTSGYACSIFFMIELFMRMYVQGRMYFCNENRGWNIFDLALVVLSIVDFIVDLSTGGGRNAMATGMKTVKMLRIVRVFRVFRFFQELSLLALMIVDSTANLGWALILLALIIYVFAILFTSEAAAFINQNEHDMSYEREVVALKEWFGSLPRTIYSLIQAMLGGVSWGVCSDSLLYLSLPACGLFIFYVAFTMLAVMNVVTGVFVENAVETARTTRDFLIAKEMELKEKYAAEMRDLFIEMDKDGSGTVGLEEINEYLQDPRVTAFFKTLGLDTGDTERLFKLIDDDGSGDVDVGEFLDGCLRLKGEARSLDVYAIMHDMKALDAKVDDLVSAIRHQALLDGSLKAPALPQAENGYAPPCFALQASPREVQQSTFSTAVSEPDGVQAQSHAPIANLDLSRRSQGNSCAQPPATPRTPQVVTVTTTATATLV